MDKSNEELYQEAVHEHAVYLGLDPEADKEYMFIAEEALNAPIPPDWEQGTSDDGTPYFFNTETGESRWEHPSDDLYRQKFYDLKEAKRLKVAEKVDVEPKAKETSSSSGFGRDWKSWLVDEEEENEESEEEEVQKVVTPPAPIVQSNQVEINEMKTQVAKVQLELAEKTTEISEMKIQIRKKDEALEEANKSIDHVNSIRRKVESELESTRQEVLDLKHQRQEIQLEMERFERREEDLQAQIDKSVAECARLTQHQETLVQKHMENLAAVQQSCDSVMKEKKGVELKFEQMKHQISELKEERITMEQDNKELVVEVTNLRDKLVRLEGESLAGKGKIAIEQEELAEKKVTFEIIEKSLKERERLVKEHEEEQYMKTIALERQVAILKGENKVLQEELDGRVAADHSNHDRAASEKEIERLTYQIARTEEQFVESERWRKREVKRVEEKDAQVIALMEELGRLRKSVASDEHQVILQQKNQLEQQLEELKQELESYKFEAKEEKRNFELNLDQMKQQIATRLPELATAAARRANEEWRGRYDKSVYAITNQFQEQAQREALRLSQMETQCRQVEQDCRYGMKNATSEATFLRKELVRVEENNKILLDQLQTMRTHMTQYGALKFMHGYPPAPPDNTFQNLQQQIATMQESFRALLNRDAERKERFSTEPVKENQSPAESSTSRISEIIESASLKTSEPSEPVETTEKIVPLNAFVAPINLSDATSTWYRDGYWKTKYLNSKMTP